MEIPNSHEYILKKISHAVENNFEWLGLNNCGLTELHQEIGELINLDRLYLSGNKLTRLPVEFEQLTKLTRLDLRGNNFVNIPKEILRLTNLTVLDLRGNNLTEVTSDIGKLTNLTRLDLSDNNLVKLPFEIGYLVNLKELYLDGNKIKPSFFCHYDIYVFSKITKVGCKVRTNEFWLKDSAELKRMLSSKWITDKDVFEIRKAINTVGYKT